MLRCGIATTIGSRKVARKFDFSEHKITFNEHTFCGEGHLLFLPSIPKKDVGGNRVVVSLQPSTQSSDWLLSIANARFVPVNIDGVIEHPDGTKIELQKGVLTSYTLSPDPAGLYSFIFRFDLITPPPVTERVNLHVESSSSSFDATNPFLPRKHKTTPSTYTSPIPSHLDWKQIGDPLGSGGQGTVYLVQREDEPEIFRALKMLKDDAPQQARQRFQQEVINLGNISHPAIIRIIEYSLLHQDFQYLVMDFHEGARTIEEVCLVSPELNPYHGNVLKCLDLFEQIILALRACEQATEPIYHRDISPKNILLLPDDSIRLIDFGLSQTVNNTTITLTGENIGTRSYAPPECGAGSKFPIGTHTDIYSAAKVLWSAITSTPAFDRESPYFEDGSMMNMFPNKEETWHLRRLFENTIQENPLDRFSKTEMVLLQIDEIRYVINGGYTPTETAFSRCPSCGLKSVKVSSNPHHLFGHFTVGKYSMSECSECGFVIVRRFNATI